MRMEREEYGAVGAMEQRVFHDDSHLSDVSASLELLPAEVIELIAAHLPLPSLLQCLLVSTRWFRLFEWVVFSALQYHRAPCRACEIIARLNDRKAAPCEECCCIGVYAPPSSVALRNGGAGLTVRHLLPIYKLCGVVELSLYGMFAMEEYTLGSFAAAMPQLLRADLRRSVCMDVGKPPPVTPALESLSVDFVAQSGYRADLRAYSNLRVLDIGASAAALYLFPKSITHLSIPARICKRISSTYGNQYDDLLRQFVIGRGDCYLARGSDVIARSDLSFPVCPVLQRVVAEGKNALLQRAVLSEILEHFNLNSSIQWSMESLLPPLLFQACMNCNVDQIRMLVDLGADVNFKPHFDRSCILQGVQVTHALITPGNVNTEVPAVLARLGFLLSMPDYGGETALVRLIQQFAQIDGLKQALLALVDAGFRRDDLAACAVKKRKHGRGIESIICPSHHDAPVEERRAICEILQQHFGMRDCSDRVLLLDPRGTNMCYSWIDDKYRKMINVRDSEGNTPLHCISAVMRSHCISLPPNSVRLDLVGLWLKWDPSLMRVLNNGGETFLHYAARSGCLPGALLRELSRANVRVPESLFFVRTKKHQNTFLHVWVRDMAQCRNLSDASHWHLLAEELGRDVLSKVMLVPDAKGNTVLLSVVKRALRVRGPQRRFDNVFSLLHEYCPDALHVPDMKGVTAGKLLLQANNFPSGRTLPQLQSLLESARVHLMSGE